mgnify:CR=1 FL=1
MLGDLVAVDDGADLEGDLGLAAQWIARTPNGGGDDGEIGFGRRQQVLALARALAREIGIAADDQPLARKVRCAEFDQVAFVEQPHLQMPLLDQGADRGALERTDPTDALGLAHLGDDLLRDHAAVAHHHQLPDAEALAQALHLLGAHITLVAPPTPLMIVAYSLRVKPRSTVNGPVITTASASVSLCFTRAWAAFTSSLVSVRSSAR